MPRSLVINVGPDARFFCHDLKSKPLIQASRIRVIFADIQSQSCESFIEQILFDDMNDFGSQSKVAEFRSNAE